MQEIFTALKLEKNFSKEQIMETYLNIAFFSNQCYGIQSASKLYFNKDISELNVAEAATLIAITNAPTKYNPLRMNANEDYGWRTGMEEKQRAPRLHPGRDVQAADADPERIPEVAGL